MYMIKRYFIPAMILCVMVLMYLDEPNVALNEPVIIDIMENAVGVGDLLGERVFKELESSNLVVMKTSDFAYRARYTTGVFAILLLLWFGEFISFGNRFDRIEEKVDGIEYWLTTTGGSDEE